MTARSGHVYVMDMGSGHIKVGFSNAPHVRATVVGGLSVLHATVWIDRAELVERAAHRLLRLAGFHIKNEVFSATVAEAISAIDKAHRMLQAGELDVRRRPNRRKKPIHFAIDAGLMEQLEAFIAEQDVPPGKGRVVELAIREFLASHPT